MVDIQKLRDELQEGIDRLRLDQEEFLIEMRTKIDKAEQGLVLDTLEKVSIRLSSIESKLAEMDKDDATTPAPPKVR